MKKRWRAPPKPTKKLPIGTGSRNAGNGNKRKKSDSNKAAIVAVVHAAVAKAHATAQIAALAVIASLEVIAPFFL